MNVANLKLIAFDADDTLWVNEPNYINVEKRIHAILAAHTDAETISRHFYHAQIRNLRIFGYGAKGYMLSMIETAIELTGGEVTGHEIQQIIDTGKELIHYPIELLPGVRETLETLHGHYELMVLTKGDLFDQESKIARSGLGPFFSHVEIVSEKNEPTYQRLLSRYAIRPEEFLMIGNSLKSDVLPVIHIGGQAVHIPYEITWGHEQVSDEQLLGKNFLNLSAMTELLSYFGHISTTAIQKPDSHHADLRNAG
ncbi:HAD family hydrolase [Tellurirhabdus rosea]|uniref:HAD family hydrolase n=1 Tax=Tellurirhabdus rosea TaxID=2674997 RepID=UPI00224D7068|nr:HAD family hydrolase [Tellurirhabdus rosea]